MESTITYETLFDMLRKESSKEDLQTLPQNFYEEAKRFMKEKQQETTTGHRATIEYENAKKLLRELYDRRERKILLLALNKSRAEETIIDQERLLTEEKPLFEQLVNTLKEQKREALARLSLQGTTATTNKTKKKEPVLEEPKKEDKSGYVKVRFKQAVPKFIGKDMTIFGPYDTGAEEELPEDIATVLLKKGRAEEI